MGKGPGCPGGDPRGNRTAPTGPGRVRSCSQAAMSQRAAPQRRSPVFRRRGPPPGCPWAGRGRGRGRAPTGASQPPLLRAPRGRAASFPTPPLLVFIDRSPSHPPPPLRPTIRFLKSPFVSQEAGEREGERDAEAEGGGGSLPVASDRSGQEGICRRRGRGLFPKPSAGAAEGVGEPPAHGTQRALSPRALDTLGPSSPAGGRSGQPAARAPWAGQTRLSAALAGRGQRGRPLFSFALLPAPLATWALGGCRARGCETTAATLNLSPPRDYCLYSFPRPSAATSPHPQAPALREPPLFGGWEGVRKATSEVLAVWRGAVGKRIHLRTVPLGTWRYTGFSWPLSLTPAPQTYGTLRVGGLTLRNVKHKVGSNLLPASGPALPPPSKAASFFPGKVCSEREY